MEGVQHPKHEILTKTKGNMVRDAIEDNYKCHRLWHILYETHGELLWGRREVAVWMNVNDVSITAGH